jgi:hypothetical protein
VTSELSPPARKEFDSSLENLRARLGIENAELRGQRFGAKNNRSLRAREGKTNLVYADIQLLVLRISAGRETNQGCEHCQTGKNANHLSSGRQKS